MSNIDEYIKIVKKNDLDAANKNYKEEYLYHIGKNGFTPFLQACQLGLLEMVQFFVDKEVNFESTTMNGWNCLHYAAGDGHEELVKLLLKHNADKESETNKKFRPLHLASLGDHEKIVTLLLCQGCDHTAVNREGHTPLDIAESMANDRSAYILKEWIKYISTPYHEIALTGMPPFSSVIVDRPRDVDKRDRYGFTSLHHAVINKDDIMCGILLKQGAYLCAPLEITQDVINDRELDKASVPLSDIENPVTLSLKLYGYILPSLMEKIVGTNVKFVLNGNTFLHLSSKLLLSETSAQLIKQGADVNIQNVDGDTPLHGLFIKSYHDYLTRDGFMDTLAVLVDNGANINLLNNESISPFRCAFDTKNNNIVGAMLKRCDRVDCRIEDFFTIYETQWHDVFQKMWSLQEQNFQIELIMESIELNMEGVVDSILENSSEEFRQVILEDCLFNSAILNHEEIFYKLSCFNLQHSKYFPGGETLLTKLITMKDEKYSKTLAKSTCGKRFLDLPNQKQQTPLYLAAANGCLKLCKHLVVKCQNISYSDDNGETAMERLLESVPGTGNEYAVRKVETIVMMMVERGMDINRVNKANKRAISFCKNDKLKKNLEEFQREDVDNLPKQAPNSNEDENLNDTSSAIYGPSLHTEDVG